MSIKFTTSGHSTHLYFVYLEDWVGVYQNGHLIYQGHRISGEKLATLLNISHDAEWVEDWDYDIELPETTMELHAIGKTRKTAAS